MSFKAFAAALAFAAAAFTFALPAQAQATDPAAKQIETFYATLTDAMKSGGTVQSRYNKLKPTVEQVFDLKAMTSLAVGPTWTVLPVADKDALVAAFTRMTIANYAKNFDGYHGEKFTVDPAVETRGQDKIVKSKLTTGSGEAIPFTYRMRNNKIIDIFLNGNISQMATQRADYTSTVASGGAPALVKKLNDMSDKLMK